LHVLLDDDQDADSPLKFRDHLNSHPEAIEEYAQLKRNIKHLLDEPAESSGALGKSTMAKNEFIQSILRKAVFDELYRKFVNHHSDKIHAETILKKLHYNLPPTDISVGFYRGVEIAGYPNAKKNWRFV
jgi:hypothetical protein